MTSTEAAAKYVEYRTKAETEITTTRGSITRAGVYAQIAGLYLVEAQLRAQDAPVLPPDAA